MKIISNQVYHIYNQGNNKEQIFYTEEHYLLFLRLIKRFVSPKCEILAYCLMPNHFHFLIHTNEVSANKIKSGAVLIGELSNGFRLVQSIYAQELNNERGRTGSLFKQHAKAKLSSTGLEDYSIDLLNYIHDNPLKTNIVNDLKEWPYSSYRDYLGLRKGTLVNKERIEEVLGISIE